jgi:hypothetical protein
MRMTCELLATDTTFLRSTKIGKWEAESEKKAGSKLRIFLINWK